MRIIPPYHPSLDIHKYHLKGGDYVWQIDVDDKYRIWYRREEKLITLGCVH